MNSQIEEDKFSKENEKIKAKLESVEKEINEDLALIPEYQLLQVYSKINKIITEEEKKFTILKNKFIFIDKTLTGYINLKDFYDILNNNLSLEKDELKILLCDPALRNIINPNLYQYKPFLTRISDFNENDIIQMRQEYNIYQNKYIIELRNNIKVKNIDIKKLWENTFRDNTKCTKNNFYLLFNEINSNYSYHYLELEYIFDLICEKGDDFLKFENFQKIMNKRVGEDLRVLYFKRKQKEKEKEEKKEEDKLLINYYPNILENNTNNIINNEDKTNYIILKGGIPIDDSIENKNNNEQFILGNVNPGDSNDNLTKEINNQKNKTVSLVHKLEIPQSLVFHESTKEDESKENIDKAKTQIIPSKGTKIKKYYKILYNVKDNISKNSTILKDKVYYEELKSKTQIDIDDLIKKRIDKSNEKVDYVLSQHEEYIILKLYSSLNEQMRLIDNNLLLNILNQNNKKFLTFNEFISFLQSDLKLKFNPNDLNILLNSLEDNDSSKNLFSLEEFIKNLNNYKDSNNYTIKNIENLALINFNLYLIDFKKFIINNNININEIFNAISNDKMNLTFDDFISFCESFHYKLSSIDEYKYIFNILSKDNSNNLLSKNDLNWFVNSKFITEEKFIEDGKCKRNFGKNKNKNWYKYIPTYNITNENFNLKFMKHFEKLLIKINKQKIKFGINNFVDFFSLVCDVDINGNVYKNDFIKALSIIEIINQPIIKEFLFYLEDINNHKKFQLANFIGIFEVYFPRNKKEENIPYNFKTYPKNPNIIFKNNYGYFLREDIKQIKELFSFIYEIIFYIKRKTIYSYFIKFDFYHKEYFTLDQLKLILIDDLGINKPKLIEIFLSYILENEKIDDFHIIKIYKLIEMITRFLEIKTEEEENNLRKTFNYSDEILNKLNNSTIMNIRLNKRQGSSYNYSPNSGIF